MNEQVKDNNIPKNILIDTWKFLNALNELQISQMAFKISADSFPSVETIANLKPHNSYIMRCSIIWHGYNISSNMNKWLTQNSKIKASTLFWMEC